MTDSETLLRTRLVETATVAAADCQTLADLGRPQGEPTLASNLWTALSCWQAACVSIGRSLNHPTFETALTEACDYGERALLMLRAISAALAGDDEKAAMFAMLAGAE